MDGWCGDFALGEVLGCVGLRVSFFRALLMAYETVWGRAFVFMRVMSVRPLLPAAATIGGWFVQKVFWFFGMRELWIDM